MILNRAENITIFTTMMTHYMAGNLTAFYEAVVVVVATKGGEKTEGGGAWVTPTPPLAATLTSSCGELSPFSFSSSI